MLGSADLARLCACQNSADNADVPLSTVCNLFIKHGIMLIIRRINREKKVIKAL